MPTSTSRTRKNTATSPALRVVSDSEGITPSIELAQLPVAAITAH